MPWGGRAHSAPLVLFGGEGTENRQIVCFGWRELGKLGAGAQICRVFVLRRVCGGRLLWLVCGARAVVEVDQLQPIRWGGAFRPVGAIWWGGYKKSADFGFVGERPGEIGEGEVNLPVFCTVGHLRMGRERGACGAWARCVWGVGGVRVGRGRDACTGLGKFAPLKRSDLGKWEREVQMCQNQCIFHAPPAHLLPQYCTLLGKTRHRHRPRTGRRLQTVRPGTSATSDSAAPALPARPGTSAAPAPPVRTACPPHPVLPDHPQTLTPPANSETPRPPKW